MKEIFKLKHEMKENEKYRKEKTWDTEKMSNTRVITVQEGKVRENGVEIMSEELIVENLLRWGKTSNYGFKKFHELQRKYIQGKPHCSTS